MKTYEITSDMLVEQLVDIDFDGPRVTFPGSPVKGEQLEVADPTTQVRFHITNGNTVTAPQCGVIRNAMVNDVPGGRSMKVGDAYHALRALHNLTDKQQDSILVERILGALRAKNRHQETTERQDNVGLRLVDALTNGTSLGEGQEHLDRKIVSLPPRIKESLIVGFLEAENKGQYDKARKRFDTIVGKFNYSVGRAAEERRAVAAQNTIIEVTPELMAAWSDGIVVPVAESSDSETEDTELVPAGGVSDDEQSNDDPQNDEEPF